MQAVERSTLSLYKGMEASCMPWVATVRAGSALVASKLAFARYLPLLMAFVISGKSHVVPRILWLSVKMAVSSLGDRPFMEHLVSLRWSKTRHQGGAPSKSQWKTHSVHSRFHRRTSMDVVSRTSRLAADTRFSSLKTTESMGVETPTRVSLAWAKTTVIE